MTIAWMLNSLSLLVTTIGTLLIFLYLYRAPRFADQWLSPQGKLAYEKHRRTLMVAVGLLSLWFLMQYLAVILI